MTHYNAIWSLAKVQDDVPGTRQKFRLLFDTVKKQKIIGYN